MESILRGRAAFGQPGIPPRWTHSAKEGVGTAYNTASRVWFTLSHGTLNEVYFPTVDSPQIRDMEFLVTDGRSFFHEEKRDLATEVQHLDCHSLGYLITCRDPGRRYRIVKEIICDPHLPCVLIHARLEGDEAFLRTLRVYVLLAPHLNMAGYGNNAAKVHSAGRELLVAYRQGYYLALGATVPFQRASCGYVGVSDGWKDLHRDFRMDWEFDFAADGNVALMGELDLSQTRSFTVGLAFGFGLHAATSTLHQSVRGHSFEAHKTRFQEQWERACRNKQPLAKVSGDEGTLYHTSFSLLLAHEDKTYAGAMIASLSIPWGEIHGDEDGLGGYHLVWTRDLYQSATGLLAAGDLETPLRALIYLACSQLPDGGFYQNFWVDGQPFWRGIQLDETAFPVLLAWRLAELDALGQFDPYPMLLSAAGFLVRQGPITPQERWEESSGYSPSTLAVTISALVCAAQLLRRRNDAKTAVFLEEYADFLESHVERWTVTSEGRLFPGIPRHYIRIHPASASSPEPQEDPNRGRLSIPNSPPEGPWEFPAKEIVDAGFLELVRYGIRRPNDPLIEDSLRVVDATLKVTTPFGPCWRRYNHDGFGQRDDGGAFEGWGRGRPWPLLTGERAHYELAAGRDVSEYVRAIEGFASLGQMLPEQIWDGADIPERELYVGRPTGSAMPLMWAHAEYVKLLRSIYDGSVFDLIPPVAARYRLNKGRRDLEVWSFNRRVAAILSGETLRVQASAPFRLKWTGDEWASSQDALSETTAVGIHFVDLRPVAGQKAPLRFTFFWTETNRWEGTDFSVRIREN